ncbi:MAG: ABC transporter permease [Chloroflexi bacterium]|nr:ABC transporter permease [Chloroflexota bacterium]
MRALGALQTRYPLVQAAALVLVLAYGAISINGFASQSSINAMLVLSAILGVAAAGQTVVILVGGIDLSVASWVVAGASMIIELYGKLGWPFVLALAVIVVAAAVAGGFAGYVSSRYRLQPLVVTLAVGSCVGGAILASIGTYVNGLPPPWLQQAASPAGTTLGMPLPPVVLLWVATAVVLGVFLQFTPAGRRLYATGSNPRAAETALVRTRWVWTAAFAVSATFAALAGVLIAGFSGASDASLGDSYLWLGLTAVIVGGTAFGARGDYWRTALGCLFLTALSTVLIGKGMSTSDQQIVNGLLILLVVGFYARERQLADRI